MGWPQESYRHQLAAKGTSSRMPFVWRSQADKMQRIKYVPGEENPQKMMARWGVLHDNQGASVEERVQLLIAIYGMVEDEIMRRASQHKNFDEFYQGVIFAEQRDVKHWYRYPEMRDELKQGRGYE